MVGSGFDSGKSGTRQGCPSLGPQEEYLRILVVEDDQEAARYLKKGLQESGFNVTLTPDGDEGLVLAMAGGLLKLLSTFWHHRSQRL